MKNSNKRNIERVLFNFSVTLMFVRVVDLECLAINLFMGI